MGKNKRKRVIPEEIKYYSDSHANWDRLIPGLKTNHFVYEKASFLSIHGDAPKNFIRVYTYGEGRRSNPQKWPGYIAKVGHKWYPIESITEHFLTRVGEALELSMAQSMVRRVGRQIRFMSKYFLNNSTELVHGAQLFSRLIGDEMVKEIAEKRLESEFYTFQAICMVIEEAFPDQAQELIFDLVRMIAFDAIIGHNDRHPFNWGIIVPISKKNPPVFSPIFDTARALFWNISEKKINQMLKNEAQFNAYLKKTSPSIGWDSVPKISHFDLVEMIKKDYSEYKEALESLLSDSFIPSVEAVLESEFKQLFSESRRNLILECLKTRYSSYSQSVTRKS